MRRSTAKKTKSNVCTLTNKDCYLQTGPLVQPGIGLILGVLPCTLSIDNHKLKPPREVALRVHLLVVLTEEIQDVSLYSVSA